MGIKDIIKTNKILSKPAYNLVNANVAKKQYKNNIDILKRIECQKDIHKGERCFIIGTGPSLTVKDLEMLDGEVTFATNRIYELFNQTEWRPTYYVNQDHNLIQKFSDKIKEIKAKLLFLPVDYCSEFTESKYRFFVLKHKEYYPKKAPFSSDISKYLAQGFTVTYGAIQIALYMGFKEIYLLGIDHNYNISRDAKGQVVRAETDSRNYPKGMNEYISINNLPRVEETTIAYETAEKVSYRYGARIYNCTRGGKLEAFKRKTLESVLEVE